PPHRRIRPQRCAEIFEGAGLPQPASLPPAAENARLNPAIGPAGYQHAGEDVQAEESAHSDSQAPTEDNAEASQQLPDTARLDQARSRGRRQGQDIEYRRFGDGEYVGNRRRGHASASSRQPPSTWGAGKFISLPTVPATLICWCLLSTATPGW